MSLALVFLVYGEIMSFKCKENHRPPGLVFCCCGRFRCSLRFFLFLFFSLFFIFSFSCKDSHEKFTWQASRLSTSGASFSGSRARILFKSAHAKYCLHDDSCSRTRILTRSGNSENIVCLRCVFSYNDSL